MREFVGAGLERAVWWAGEVPVRCERCGELITALFVDCKTVDGVWGCFCLGCAGEVAVAAGPPLCRAFQQSAFGWVSLF